MPKQAGVTDQDAQIDIDASGTHPRTLILWVTTDCNLRCVYCYANGGDNKAYMGWDVAKRAIDLVAEGADCFKVQLAGGEPLLNFGLIERIVFFIHDLGADASIQLQTNATLISPAIASRLRALGIGVGVSLDGVPAINDHLRPFADGHGSTHSVINGIRNLRDAGISVGMTSVLSSTSVKGLSSLVDLASYLGNVAGISLDPLRPLGRGSCDMMPSPHLTAEHLYKAIKRSEYLAGSGGNPVRFREVERMRCLLKTGGVRRYRCYFDAYQSLMVCPNGDAYPCASLHHPDFRLGNILEPRFWDTISERLRDARRSIKTPHKCMTCSELWLCGGPCPAGVFSRAGGAEIECAVKRVFVKYVTGSLH
ncbi:radical SAM protein [Methanothrix sp.]|uniref:radical SAM/SPASM domain-containing protein n=1 Tax=Methanothrix sp. TaxID=90426 RepID=UPI00257E2027|nr:radical SAM protein [Methanothrix sp.]